jgi:hypothetical protein
MELEGRRDQQETGRFVRQRNARKVAAACEVAPLVVPEDTHPVVERLKGKVKVLRRLEFDDGQPAGAGGSQQVRDAALATGKRGYLAVQGAGAEIGVYLGQMGADLRFEPELGIAGAQRAERIGRVSGTHAHKVVSERLDLSGGFQIGRAGGVDAEACLTLMNGEELKAADTKTPPAGVVYALDAGNLAEPGG